MQVSMEEHDQDYKDAMEIEFAEWDNLKKKGFYDGMSLDFLKRAYKSMESDLIKTIFTITLARSGKDLEILRELHFTTLIREIDADSYSFNPPKMIIGSMNEVNELLDRSIKESEYGLIYFTKDNQIGEEASEANELTYKVGDVYSAPVMAIYASLLYRLRNSINFLVLTEIGIHKGQHALLHDANVVKIPKYDDTTLNDIRARGVTQDEYEDGIVIQAIHAIACYQRMFKLQNNVLEFQLHCTYAWYEGTSEEAQYLRQSFDKPIEPEGSKWGALKDADFWSYEVGDVTLYIKPTKVIFKIFYWGVGDKFSATNVINTSTIELLEAAGSSPPREYKFEYDLVEFISNLRASQLNISGGETTDKIVDFIDPWNDKIGGDKKRRIPFADSYLLLQSPSIFGKYMHPEGLTSSSKVVRLGKI